MWSEPDTTEGGSRRRPIPPSPSQYFERHDMDVTSAGIIGDAIVTANVITESGLVAFVDIGSSAPLSKFFGGQTGIDKDEKEHADWLPEALKELDEAPAEAEEEGYRQVTDLAAGNARKLLNDLARRVVRAPMVHSTPEGGIAIDFRNPDKDAAVLILCEPDGEGVCFHDIENERGRIRYSDTKNLLDAGGWFAISQAELT